MRLMTTGKGASFWRRFGRKGSPATLPHVSQEPATRASVIPGPATLPFVTLGLDPRVDWASVGPRVKPEDDAVGTNRSSSTAAPLWKRRRDRSEKLIAATSALLGLCGLMLMADGLYIKAKAELSQLLLARSFAAELAGKGPAKPWPWADFVTEAKISAPRIGQSAIVLSGANGETLAFGPAWLASTPKPGEEGTAVIAAHRDTHFRWLKDVKPGDRIEVERADGRHLTFVAGQGRVARWDENGIDLNAEGHHLALATCWPFDATTRGPMRYILDAELVEDTAQVF